jgi:hypothetical protein
MTGTQVHLADAHGAVVTRDLARASTRHRLL